MGIIAKSSGSGESFRPAPKGVHQAVLVDVVDLGVLETTWQGQTKKQHKVNLVWQIAEDREDGKPFLVFKRYSLSMHEKAGLRKDMENWCGRTFGREEEMGFDVESMLGKNCILNVTHRQLTDRTYANVTSVNPLMNGMKPIRARDFVRKIHRVADPVGPQASTAMGGDECEIPPLTDDDIPF